MEPRLCLGAFTAPLVGDLSAPVEPIIEAPADENGLDLLSEDLSQQLPEPDVLATPDDDSAGNDPWPDENDETIELNTEQLTEWAGDGGTAFDQFIEVTILDSEIELSLDAVDVPPPGDPAGEAEGEAVIDATEVVAEVGDDIQFDGSTSTVPTSSPPSASSTQEVPDGQQSAAPSATDQQSPLSMETLSSYGFSVDDQGDAVAVRPWWTDYSEPTVVRYDFRSVDGHDNVITEEQKARAVDALSAWSAATGGMILFEQDTTAPGAEILNIGTGDLSALGYESGTGGILSLGGGTLVIEDGKPTVRGLVWMDKSENWDTQIGNGNPPSTFDYFSVAAHETGHAIGLADTHTNVAGEVMNGNYVGEQSADSIRQAIQNGHFDPLFFQGGPPGGFYVSPQMTGFPQLVEPEVEQLLARAAAASASNDAIIAIVDRGGNILGVRVESGALAAIPDEQTLIFAIDGAVAKARTAAFFASDAAPLTSRLVQFISQSTVTEREVESNPNAEVNPVTDMRTAADVYASTVYGPGFVAPIGLGAHFPPGVAFTPPVDLFAIEHTNRDSLTHPGPDGIKATADDIVLPYRFNIDPAFVSPDQEINPPESYGTVSGREPNAQSRGIATLPGGVPIFRDTDGDGNGDTLIGGIGVFFPGEDGFATHEQNFVPNIGQTTFERLNADLVLEAEYIAYAALGGSQSAALQGIPGAQIGTLGGIPPVAGIDIPFGRLDLVGINLPVFGPIAGRVGLIQLLAEGQTLGQGNPASGANQPLDLGGNGIVDPDPNNPIDDDFFADGMSVPDGFLVNPHDSTLGDLTAADVTQIIQQGIDAAEVVRAAIRLPSGSRTRMVFAVTDLSGEVLGLFRMEDATFFSIDVAVAKARNVSYYADPASLQPFDQVPPVPAGVAFTNRTFRFLAGPRYPDGIDGTLPGPFSILNHPGIENLTGENIAGPPTAGSFDPAVNPITASVLGYDSFFPNTNFQDPNDVANQNGIVFFPGSIPIYKNGQLVGGFGVSGDGVDQDDVVTFFGSDGFQPPPVLRADQFAVRDVRLPYIKFLRNPFG